MSAKRLLEKREPGADKGGGALRFPLSHLEAHLTLRLFLDGEYIHLFSLFNLIFLGFFGPVIRCLCPSHLQHGMHLQFLLTLLFAFNTDYLHMFHIFIHGSKKNFRLQSLFTTMNRTKSKSKGKSITYNNNNF